MTKVSSPTGPSEAANDAVPEGMSSAAQRFGELIRNPNIDPSICDLRRSMTREKREALEEAGAVDTLEAAKIMQALHTRLVSMKLQIAARVGISVGLALEVYDEHSSNVSISSLARPLREGMTEACLKLEKRSSSPIAKLVAEVEACRLSWRHNHEFLSWLAFRRGEEKHSAADRLARLQAFKVEERLLASRSAVIAAVGPMLSMAIEAHDRFMLDNRWLLPEGPEQELEQLSWTLMSYQPQVQFEIEMRRHKFDRQRAVSTEEPGLDETLEAMRDEIGELLATQLTLALYRTPEHGVMQETLAA